MRKLISTFAALIAVSCAPTPVLAEAVKSEPVPCAKLAHYTLLVVDDSVSVDDLGAWVRRQKFNDAQKEELRQHAVVLAELLSNPVVLSQVDKLPGAVFEVCMEERGI